MEQIRFDKVSFAYATIPVLEDASFQIGPKVLVCIVGPNGSGKTTLLRLALGLEKPTEGTIKILGKPPSKARHLVGYVPQHALFDPAFPASVIDVVLMGRLGRTWTGFYRHSDFEAALQALNEVGIADYRDHPFSELSGGQRQRVLIARGLASEPHLLLLDEPTSNVDQATMKTLYRVLQDLSRRMTVVFVSHDLGLVSTIVTSVMCVNRSVVVHPTCELTGTAIRELYGLDLSLGRHDHRCAEERHSHD
ncbi:MAG: ATP-binding cassette domain-containing protein [Chitinivibrionales bacterium]|nr:ATP-binding cassette domain-containing protein [Chitinivibrionales bacterium]MBD3355855.1 ATP-binding cassette domain-containing protein [Chitinivibrionales bacterium]